MRRLCILLALVLPTLGCSGGRFRLRTESRVTVNAAQVPAVEPLLEMTVQADDSAQAKIALIDVDGLLVNMDMTGLSSQGENPVSLFREKLDAAAADPCVCAVVVRINSPGGGVTATDIMLHDLAVFKQRRQVPVVACVMDLGTGGAYYLATGADCIVAHPTSITGGVGVILNLYNLEDTMQQLNIRGRPIKAGEHVDLGSPIGPISDEGRRLLQQMADEFHARFRKAVEQARPDHDPQRSEDFDGRIFTAQQALDRGLIDSIGYLDDAITAVRRMAHLGSARTVVYHRCNDRARSLYAITPNTPLQSTLLPLSVPGLERSRLPTFLYLWQPEPTMERLVGR